MPTSLQTASSRVARMRWCHPLLYGSWELLMLNVGSLDISQGSAVIILNVTAEPLVIVSVLWAVFDIGAMASSNSWSSFGSWIVNEWTMPTVWRVARCSQWLSMPTLFAYSCWQQLHWAGIVFSYQRCSDYGEKQSLFKLLQNTSKNVDETASPHTRSVDGYPDPTWRWQDVCGYPHLWPLGGHWWVRLGLWRVCEFMIF